MVSSANTSANATRFSFSHLACLWCVDVCWLLAESVPVTKEHDTLVLALGSDVRLDPLAPSSGLPHGLEESPWSSLDVCTVVLAHNRLNSFGSLVGVVEWDGGDVVVEDVGLDDAMEDVATDEAKFTVDGCGGAADVGPGIA